MAYNKESQAKNLVMAREIFLQEVMKKLPLSQEALEALKADKDDAKAQKTLYQFAHTLKGSGTMVGLRGIAQPASELETALVLIQNYGAEMGKGILEFLAEHLAEIQEEVTKLTGKPSKPFKTVELGIARGKKILVVDDDQAITGLMKERLEQDGLKVILCHDILSAENYLKEEQPDLIVLDILLPDGDGIEFCHKIRSALHRQIVPIIFLTVKNDLWDRLVGFATGADDYLAKPFEMEELVARIGAILKRIEVYQDWAWRDELTGVYNRRYFYRRLDEELARAQRTGSSFSLAMIDLDYFKKINDCHGHLIGDKVLQALVERTIGKMRASDVICRYGGEEFVVILTNTAQAEAQLALERLRESIAHEPLRLADCGQNIPLTISVGISGYPEDGETGEQLLAAADKATYRAKEAGRDLVMLS